MKILYTIILLASVTVVILLFATGLYEYFDKLFLDYLIALSGVYICQSILQYSKETPGQRLILIGVGAIVFIANAVHLVLYNHFLGGMSPLISLFNVYLLTLIFLSGHFLFKLKKSIKTDQELI